MKIYLPEGAATAEDVILDILKNSKTIAVVRLSSNPGRASYGVTQYMQRAGYRIIPVNPRETEVLGEKCFATLQEVPEKIDVVDVFRRAELVAPVVDSAIAVGARVLWMQLGIRNAVAAEKARAAGLTVVEDACMLVEHTGRRNELKR